MTARSLETQAAALGELAVGLERESADLNEATTRLRVIDQLLFDVLGWDRDHCTAEEPLDRTFTDYSLGSPATQLIVEAKKEGVYFTIPEANGPSIVNVATLVRTNGALSDAIKQAAGYCAARGVRLAVVTNGHQIVAFLGSRDDGTAPLSGRAVVFRSLRDLEDHFVEFWNFLSPEGVAQQNLYSVLRADVRPLAPQKLSQRLWTYPGVKARNDLEIELDILGELFLQDLVRAQELEDDFLKECYLTSGALSQYALVTKDILKSRYHETVNRQRQHVQGVTTNQGIAPELWTAVVEQGVSRRPIVLLGDVGVGKTTFIRHLVRIDAREELERSIVFYVDFGSRPALRRDLERFVTETFTQQLLEQHKIDIHANTFVRAVYNGELNRLKTGIYGPLRESQPDRYLDEELRLLAEVTGQLETHLRRSLEHLRLTQERNCVVFFDNIDQRDVDFQDAVYVVAQSLAETWNLTTFVSLRPETFNASRRSGSLAAYHPRVFTISPPQIDGVIKKRLEFALKVIETGRFALSADGITLDSGLLKSYVQVLIHSLHRNQSLCECLDNVSRGNVRKALDLLTSFVGSGHVDTKKILRIWEETGKYVIPLHEFLRAIIYGDGIYYDPNASAVANAFDIASTNPREHFLLPIVLTYLERRSQHGSVELGFVLLTQVYDFCQGLGFTVDEIDLALARGTQAELLESSVGAASERPPGAERLRLTQSGAYMLHRLLASFVYYDAVIVDTPIVDDDARRSIQDARTIHERLDRADVFLDYLTAQFETLASLNTGFDFSSLVESARHDVLSVRQRVTRAEARRREEA